MSPRTLYPPIEPYKAGFLDVTATPSTTNAAQAAASRRVSHGGPGGGEFRPIIRRLFDPSLYECCC